MLEQGTVLLVDDEVMVRKATEQWLRLSGYEVISCSDAQGALAHLNPGFAGILVTDVRMPGMDGMALMHEALARVPGIPVVLVTGHGDIDMATGAMRDGAYDFIEKPFAPERLEATVQRACDKRRLMLENDRLQHDLASQSGIDARLIGLSPAIVRLKQEILLLASIDTNVIIYGETGTGKELVAQCLHEFSNRRSRNFVPVNCGAIPESLIESELFGHEAGAFTGALKKRIGKFEYADGGTFFFDEIESMPPHLQIKLLRTLQEGVIERLGGNSPIGVNLRLVAAAKADLRVEEGFREDLYYRLNQSQLHIPALRDRADDIPLLFEYYVERCAVQHGREPRRITDLERRTLQRYSWPGNVRELKNIALRFALDHRGQLADLLFPAVTPMQAVRPVQTGAVPETGSQPLAVQVGAFEAEIIRQSLGRHGGSIKAVMDELDLPRRTLNQKMMRYGINRSDFVQDAQEG
ncbi:sigma-54-dependent transcriptional regulator [Marinobacterium rhizophilum]|uniref:Sigma-54-dependent Fis family transcriptional regulator n=1 Tax=Marinobacterium rhizophilum TaxID=420402 RepID=A0ABY5HN41_9GAMM|nr:sigma-54 dependent transcriptional regulator [Marinobacterium rhizophilum]UTW13192.1 sigma-54-dependent Fis family transcriptional regulator [Marinobacterium rhizophilum]